MKTALLLLALGLLPLRAGDSIALVAHHAEGDVYEEQESFWSSAAGAARDDESNKPAFAWGAARSEARDGAMLSARESKILDEVLAVKDGARVKVRRTFVASSSTSADSSGVDGTPQRTRAAFEGGTAVLVADGEGTRIVGELDGEEELQPSDLALSSRWEQVVPAAPVAVGDTWSLPAELAQRLLEGLDVSKATAWCTLSRVDETEAGHCARIKLELRATAGTQLGASEVEASGVLQWNVEAGHLQELALTGEIHATDADGLEHARTFGLSHEVRKLE